MTDEPTIDYGDNESGLEEMSAEIGELAAALAKAQGEMEGAAKSADNPFFKSKYADLSAVWSAARKALSTNNLAVIQTTEPTEDRVVVVTTLAHASGQWIRGKLSMRPVKSDPQGVGSCITYARRYALAAMVGVAPEDDDGNAASGKTDKPRPPVDAKVKQTLEKAAAKGMKPLEEAWNGLTKEQRATMSADLPGLKEAAGVADRAA